MKITTILRWILALACLVFCFRQFGSGFRMGGFSAAGFLIMGFASMLAVVLLIAPETIMRACEFFSRIFTSIVLPDDKSRKPLLSYILARRYGQQLRYADAVAEYRKLIHHYPKEQTPYLELIALALRFHDERLAAKYTRLVRQRFPHIVFLDTQPTLPGSS